MNPTLSERLRARRLEPYWRAHPPVRWAVVLEEPLALQVLEATGTTTATATGTTTTAPTPGSELAATADDHALAQAPAQTPAPAGPQATPAATHEAPPHLELVLLLLTAVVWMIDGWWALRQTLNAGERQASHRSRQRLVGFGRARSGRTLHQGPGRARASVASAAAPGASPCLPIRTPSPAGSPMG